MNVLIIGGSGLIGSHLLGTATAAGHRAAGTYRINATPGLIPLDGADAGAFSRILDTERPDVVVHAAGWTWVDGCENDPERAFAENARQPAQMAERCRREGIRFAYFSSSYVFDGTTGPCDENSAPNPVNVYGRSKLEGEQRIQEACEGAALIARVICVYGAEARGKNFACQVWRAMTEGREMRLPSDQCGNPSYAADLAAWVLSLLSQGQAGVWHLAGPWPECTRVQWAQRLVGAFGRAGIAPASGFRIEPVTTAELNQPAARPLLAGMVTIRDTGMLSPATDFDESVRELVAATVTPP